MRRSLIVARARNGVIGRDNALPWHLPADLAFFKRTTMGHPILMGRRTWQSIGRPLPGRRSIVVSGTLASPGPDVVVVPSLAEAWGAAAPADEAFVIGGARLFAEALPGADRIYLTEVDGDVDGDVSIPPFVPEDWTIVPLGEHPADDRHRWPLRFLRLDRLAPASSLDAPPRR
jgi:dihydrofolate reductase